MQAMTLQQAETIVAGWRGGRQPADGWESPAGPLFGDHAEADITLSGMRVTTCGTNCTMSCVMDSKVVRMCC
jgi:hypothetical protein